MFTYKSFTVIVQSRGTRFDIMEGYYILHSCKSAQAAKAWITRNLKKGTIDTWSAA